MKKRPILLLIVLILSAYGCSSDGPGDAEIIAKINDYDLSSGEFTKQLAEELAQSGTTKVDETIRREFLELLIREELMIQEAKKLNLDRQEKFIRAIERYWESTLIRDLIELKSKEISESVIISQDELRKYYKTLIKQEVLPPFDDMEEILEEQLKEKKKSDVMDQWINDLRKSAKVEINEDLLSKNM